MRKQTAATTRKKEQQERPKRYCQDCAHSYDWHSQALDGHLILCRCKLDEKTDHGKWCKFLSDIECRLFKPRTDAKAQ
jgi:hypothetical protein